MATIESPSGIELEVDRSFQAARVSSRPLEFASKSGEVIGGHYGTVLITGLTTVLNVGDAIASLRWTDTMKLLVLLRLHAYATIVTAFTTAQETSLDLVRVNGFTASDTGGVASQLAALLAGGGRKRNTMRPSVLGDLRIANATALGAGTAVAIDGPLGFAALNCGNVVGGVAGENLFTVNGDAGEHPIVLGPNEGLRVRIGVTQGAVGVVRFSLVLDWAEIPSY